MGRFECVPADVGVNRCSYRVSGMLVSTCLPTFYKILNATEKRDTVNSVGYWTTKLLPFTAYNPMVRTFRHAVALDERRAKFRTNLWSPSNKTLTPGESGLSDKDKAIKKLIDEKSKGLETTHVDEVNCSLLVALFFH